MDSVKFFYDKYNYPKINQFTNKQKARHLSLVNEILSYAGLDLNSISGRRILDAGCGTGDKSVLLSKKDAYVVAIDISSGQLKEAEMRANNSNAKVKFLQKDIINDNLELLGKFDLILNLGVLHHTENPRVGFDKLVKLLNKDGIIIIGLYHKYARLRYRIIRYLIRRFVSEDPDEIMNWLLHSKIAKPIRNAPLSTLYDRYAVPYESYHTLKEVKQWFNENNLELIGNSKNVVGNEFFKLFEPKTIFFVAGKKKK